jgi:hypothetical protein
MTEKSSNEVLKESTNSFINDGMTSIAYGFASIVVGALILLAADLASAK